MTDQELIVGFSTYQEARAFSPATVRRRRHSLGRFVKIMAPASITIARPADIDEWLSKLRTPQTRKAYRGDLGAFFAWAVSRGLLETNPVDAVGGVRVPRALPKPAAATDIAAAFSVAAEPRHRHRGC